jgi:hypothetical protein
MMVWPAASEIEQIMTTGIAMSNRQGVATTKTARNRKASPLAAHAKSAMVIATGV